MNFAEMDVQKMIEDSNARQKFIGRIVQECFAEGVHYGNPMGETKPGDRKQKPSLLKAGAQEALAVLGLTADFHPEVIQGDGETTPSCQVIMRCEARDEAGVVVGVGYGAANSHEKKFRWRKGALTCPACGKDNVRMSNDGDGYYCWRKTDGCGKTFPKDAFTGVASMVQNPDPWDLQNNLIKYAEKRSEVDVALRLGFGAYFTQDQEDTASTHTQAADPFASTPAPKPAPAPATTSSATAAPTPTNSTPTAIADPALTGVVHDDINALAAAIGNRTGRNWRELVAEASGFKAADGKVVSFSVASASKSAKWLGSTLSKLQRLSQDSALAAASTGVTF